MKIRTADKPWNKRRFVRQMAAVLAFGVFVPVQVSAEEVAAAEVDESVVDAETNEFTSSYLELVDAFVTAERIPSSRLDTPANVIVITADEIEANHYQDVGEALSHVPGVFVSSHDNRATINGNNRVLILIDGQRMDNDAGIFQSISADLRVVPSMKMIDRIEIVKGGGSALYGSDAVGGVINIITKRGEYLETTVDVNFGSWKRQNYELAHGGSNGKLHWFGTGSLRKSDNFDYNGSTQNHDYANYIINNSSMDASYILSDYKDKTASIRADYDFSDRDSVSLRFNHTSHSYAENENFLFNSLDLFEFDSSDVYNNLSLSYNFKGDTEVPGFVRLFNNHKSTYLGSANTFEGKGKTSVYGLDYQNGWEIGRHKLIAGLELHQLKSDFTVGYTEKKETTQAYYVQDTMGITDKWTFVPGVRLDHSNRYDNHWSPKAAVNYRADDKTKVYASWGRFYRSPTVYDRYYSNDVYMFMEAALDRESLNDNNYTDAKYRFWGDASLEPETGHTETIGFEHSFNDDTYLSMNFFNTRVNHAIYWSWADWTSVLGSNNGSNYAFSWDDGKEKQRGFEIDFRQSINENWGYNLLYTHIKSERDYPMDGYLQENPLFTATGKAFTTPNNSYKLGVHYQNGAWKANLYGTLGRGLGNNLPNYTVFDFNTSYDVSDRATVYFKANNFTNKDYSYYRGYHQPGRFFALGAQYKF